MKLSVQLKVQPTPEQADALKRTLIRANEACDYISRVAWENKTFRQFAIHKLVYSDVRETFGLTAQLAVRCIGKVADSYKIDTKVCRTFSPVGAVPYDDRIVYYNSDTISIWTLDGRQTIPFVCGQRHKELLQTRRGETDLTLVNGEWYLFAVCDVETPEPIDVEGVLGIDLGVTNIATDSDGTVHQGKALKNIRYRHRSLRNRLQRKGTKSAKRRLRRLAGHERRFATDVNHVLSKRIVAKAEGTKRAIALEELTHIRSRITARRSQRATLHSWAFAQLRAFIVYKAMRVGVPVHFVDPRNTSRTCPECGHCSKENRKTQASFVCTSCGLAGLADVIAAGNISRRAPVSVPYVSEAVQPSRQGQATRLQSQ